MSDQSNLAALSDAAVAASVSEEAGRLDAAGKKIPPSSSPDERGAQQKQSLPRNQQPSAPSKGTPKLPLTTTQAAAAAAADSTHVVTGSPTKKRGGRPLGSKNKKPKQPPRKKQLLGTPKETLADCEVVCTKERQAKAQAEVERAQEALERAQQKLKKEVDWHRQAVSKQADDILATWKTTDHMDRAEWIRYYKCLTTYKEQNGNCNVKISDKTDYLATFKTESNKDQLDLKPRTMLLARWVQRQRHAYRKGKMESYQKVLLDRIEFEWVPLICPDDSKWQRQFQELQDYHREHGNTKVPLNYGKLGRWCGTQRSQYRNACHSKTPALSRERIQKLESVGFEWSEPVKPVPFAERFEQLRAYRQKHGHANVPWRWPEDLALAGRVNRMRNSILFYASNQRDELHEGYIFFTRIRENVFIRV